MGEITNRFSPAKITDSPDTILGLNPTNDKYDPWLAVDAIGNVWAYNKDTEVWSVVNLVFEGITTSEALDTNLPGNYLRKVTGTVENTIGVLDAKSIMTSFDTSAPVFSKIQMVPDSLILFAFGPSGVKQVNLDNASALTYSADYSADYVDRSLVDKEYVDTKVAIPGYPSYASTAAAAADVALASGSVFKVKNGDGTAALHIKD